MQESEWIVSQRVGQPSVLVTRRTPAVYLPTFPNIDIRSRVVARGFDPSTGRVVNEAIEVLALREMIVPAMMTGTAPVVAPDQIMFVLGDSGGTCGSGTFDAAVVSDR